jgi:hypothetical protein
LFRDLPQHLTAQVDDSHEPPVYLQMNKDFGLKLISRDLFDIIFLFFKFIIKYVELTCDPIDSIVNLLYIYCKKLDII